MEMKTFNMKMLSMVFCSMYILLVNASEFPINGTDSSTEHVTSIADEIKDDITDVKSIKKLPDNDNDVGKLSKYIVSVRSAYDEKDGFGKGHVCVGTVIKPDVVISSCFVFYELFRTFYVNNPDVYVTGGTRNIIKKDNNTEKIEVLKLYIHPQYDSFKYTDDIVLLILKRSIVLNDESIGIASLPLEPPTASMKCLSVGWSASFDDQLVYDLSSIEVVVKSTNYCKQEHIDITSKEICIDYHKAMPIFDWCEIDPGSPLFYGTTIVGIKPHSRPCGVYINVYEYLSWINSEKSEATTPLFHLFSLFFPILLTYTLGQQHHYYNNF